MITSRSVTKGLADKLRELGWGGFVDGPVNDPSSEEYFRYKFKEVYFRPVVGEKLEKGRSIEIYIEGVKDSGIGEYLMELNNDEFWKANFPTHIRKKRNDSIEFLDRGSVDNLGNGNYKFGANLKTQSDRKVVNALYNQLMRPIVAMHIIMKKDSS